MCNVIRRALYVALVVIVMGCHPTGKAEHQAPRTTPGCTFGERTRSACNTLERAALLDADGTPIPLVLTECWMPGLYAHARWYNAQSNETYRALVKFTARDRFQALRPLSAEPILLEWPAPPTFSSRARFLRVRTAEVCEDPWSGPVLTEVALPELTSSSCAGESRLTQGRGGWCTRTGRADSFYELREWRAFSSRVWHSVKLELHGPRAVVTIDGTTTRLADEPLRGLFETIWAMPVEIEESCRDGALSVVEGWRAGQWRALLRSCGAAIPFEKIEDMVSRATPNPGE